VSPHSPGSFLVFECAPDRQAPRLLRRPLAQQLRDAPPAEAGHFGDQRRRLAGVVGDADRSDQLPSRLLELMLAPLDLRGGASDRR
jgi:hypothetical protein